jgi:LOB domain-containing protein 16
MTTIDMAGAAAAATGSGSPYVRRVQVPGPAVRAGVRACSRPTSTARPRPGRRALPRFAANHKVLGASKATPPSCCPTSPSPTAARPSSPSPTRRRPGSATARPRLRLRRPDLRSPAAGRHPASAADALQTKAQLACGVQGAAHSPASHHHQWPDNASISAGRREEALADMCVVRLQLGG